MKSKSLVVMFFAASLMAVTSANVQAYDVVGSTYAYDVVGSTYAYNEDCARRKPTRLKRKLEKWGLKKVGQFLVRVPSLVMRKPIKPYPKQTTHNLISNKSNWGCLLS